MNRPFNLNMNALGVVIVIFAWAGVGALLRYGLQMSPVWSMLFSTGFWTLIGWLTKGDSK